MSRILRRFAGAALAAALGACAQAQPPAPEEPPEAARIARVEAGLLPPVVIRGREVEPMALSDRLDHYRASALSLAVIDGYEVVWAQAWGTVALGRDEEVTPESLFQAGSVSKPVAALVVASLTLKGELSLDLPLAALVEGRPEIREAVGRRLLLRHLLAHTAALPVHSWRGWYRDQELPSTAQMLAEAELFPTGPPGEEVRYSNTGYLLVQLAVEETTGRPFHRVAADALFSPLGLDHSSFQEPLPKSLLESSVWGHYQGERVRGKGRMYPAAPAGLWTTPSDLARLMAEVLRAANGRSQAVVPASIAREMIEPVLPGAERSLAWSVAGDGDARWIHQDGRVAGFTAYVVGYPERGQGVAVMSNSHGSHPLNLEVARAVAADYGWPQFVMERELVELSEGELQRFEGRYEYALPAGLVVTFTVRDGRLFGQTGEGPAWEAVPVGEREFITAVGNAVIRFEVDEEGRVTGFRIGVPGGSWTEVDRVE